MKRDPTPFVLITREKVILMLLAMVIRKFATK